MNSRSLLWSNATISLAAAGCVFASLAMSGTGGPTRGTAGFALGLSAATWCAYSWQRHIKATRKRGLRPDHLAWQQRHAPRLRRLALLIVPIAALPLLWTWIASRMTSHGQSLHTWSLILGAGIITALYAGSPGLRGRRFALRRMPGLKMIWIGGAWAVLTAIWPVWWKALEANLPLPDSTWNLALERFLVIAALTLPFDLRDRDWDAADMRTWPQLLGTAGTRLLGVTLLCGAWALRTTSLHQPWTAGIGLLPMVVMVAMARENRPAGYFVALDALLMVDALWLVLS